MNRTTDTKWFSEQQLKGPTNTFEFQLLQRKICKLKRVINITSQRPRLAWPTAILVLAWSSMESQMSLQPLGLCAVTQPFGSVMSLYHECMFNHNRKHAASFQRTQDLSGRGKTCHSKSIFDLHATSDKNHKLVDCTREHSISLLDRPRMIFD